MALWAALVVCIAHFAVNVNAQTNCTFIYNVDFTDDAGSVQTQGSLACCEACRANSSCELSVYFSGWCYFKGARAASYTNAGRVACVPKGHPIPPTPPPPNACPKPPARQDPQPPPTPATQWKLVEQFTPTPADAKDRGKGLINKWWTVDHDDATHGFPNAYTYTQPGDDSLYIDEEGYLVLEATCPNRTQGGTCRAFQCGERLPNHQICQCDNATLEHHYFPWWCQQGWQSAKIVSQPLFSVPAKGGLFVFEDVWIAKGKPLWPAIWLLPQSCPTFGGEGSQMGGNWTVWPNNGEIDLIETIGDDPRIFGTLHFQCGNEYNGWPGVPVTVNGSAQQGTAYRSGNLTGNILSNTVGDNPMAQGGHLGTLSFLWNVDPEKGTTLTWFVTDSNPISADGTFAFEGQLDVLINRKGTDSIGGVSGDGTGQLSFGSTPFWPGSKGNSPPLTLYKGWNGNYSYGFQGYYPIQGNVRQATVGIHTENTTAANPLGLGVLPKFYSNGSIIPDSIDHLYEPLLCSMLGDWNKDSGPMPWDPVPCHNPPEGFSNASCPRTGSGSNGTYDVCWVEGAQRPGVGWWSNSPMAKGVPFAPLDTTQQWNIILNVAVGGDWPRGAGQEGSWGQNYSAITPMKIKSIKYYVAQ
eukprot:TRINITY_DN4384_c0_g1_i1.p1 TRINITY_DN4384_c0_g1~~TRINITY_DN4384_c0_g1_i1.p1  ORF type:complete len:655 (+),score=90.43 TRINITY_DN4384_c0_g1_i1:53-1966(+)